MKIIFLDVDNVLNCDTTTTVTSDGWCFVDDYLVERLKHLVDATGAKIVLSSTWRDGWFRHDETLNEPCFNELRAKLRDFGIEIWDALDLPLRSRRAFVIRKWFECYKGEPIESYVILDDLPEMGEFSDHLICTDPRIGLTDDNVRAAIKILNGIL